MITTTVYVELLDEGVRAWRPVEAERLEDDRYRLTGDRPVDEVWPFTTGDVVRCEMRELQIVERLKVPKIERVA